MNNCICNDKLYCDEWQQQQWQLVTITQQCLWRPAADCLKVIHLSVLSTSPPLSSLSSLFNDPLSLTHWQLSSPLIIILALQPNARASIDLWSYCQSISSGLFSRLLSISDCSITKCEPRTRQNAMVRWLPLCSTLLSSLMMGAVKIF